MGNRKKRTAAWRWRSATRVLGGVVQPENRRAQSVDSPGSLILEREQRGPGFRHVLRSRAASVRRARRALGAGAVRQVRQTRRGVLTLGRPGPGMAASRRAAARARASPRRDDQPWRIRRARRAVRSGLRRRTMAPPLAPVPARVLHLTTASSAVGRPARGATGRRRRSGPRSRAGRCRIPRRSPRRRGR